MLSKKIKLISILGLSLAIGGNMFAQNAPAVDNPENQPDVREGAPGNPLSNGIGPGGNGNGNGNGNGGVNGLEDVPEINASSAALALGTIATGWLIAHERRKKKGKLPLES